MDFQSEFEDATKTIDDTLTTQVSSSFTWRNVPGSLVKTSVSSGGYVWGFSDNSLVYTCQLPCSGKWAPAKIQGLQTVLDIATDGSNVYVLGNATSGPLVLMSGGIAGQTPWTSIPVPFSATQIYSTHTYIWAQDTSGTKKKCAKPCMSGNWISSSDVSVKITSSSDTALYGVDSAGRAMRTDELLQTEWTPIQPFSKVKLTSVLGSVDESAVYGINDSSQLLKCDSGCKEPEPVDTRGYKPQSVSIEPHSIWMTTTEVGDVGNVFTRAVTSSFTDIMNSITPLDQKRDTIVQDVAKEYTAQTDTMTVQKQLGTVVDFFKNIFNKPTDTDTKDLQGKIRDAQINIDYMTGNETFFKILLMTLIIVGGLYLVGYLLGQLIHVIAFIVLIGGLYYAINFS